MIILKNKSVKDIYVEIELITLKKQLDDLENICKIIKLRQQTIAVIFYIFYFSKATLKLEPDDIVMQCAAINLGCKMEYINISIEDILRHAFILNNLEFESEIINLYITSIAKTEIDICEKLDFNLEPPKFYDIKINDYVGNIDRNVQWILLNDILCKPISILFSAEEIAISCYFVEYLINSKNIENVKEKDDKVLISLFLEKINRNNINTESIKFIVDEILKIYETAE